TYPPKLAEGISHAQYPGAALERNIVILERRDIELLSCTCGLWARALHPLARLGRRGNRVVGRARLRAVRPFLTRSRHKLDPFGNHLVFAPFLAVLPFPTAPLQAPFNERGAAFTQKFAGRFSLTTEGHNIDEADF